MHICNSHIDFGFCPLCFVKCVVKLIAWKDARSQLLHLFNFSPVCSLSVISNGITGRLQSHTSCICSIFRCDSYPHLCQSCQSLPILPILTNPANPRQHYQSCQSLSILQILPIPANPAMQRGPFFLVNLSYCWAIPLCSYHIYQALWACS